MPNNPNPPTPGDRIRDKSTSQRGTFREEKLAMYLMDMDDGSEGLYKRTEFVIIDHLPGDITAGSNVLLGRGHVIWLVEAIADDGTLTLLSPGDQRRYEVDPEEVSPVEVSDGDSE